MGQRQPPTERGVSGRPGGLPEGRIEAIGELREVAGARHLEPGWLGVRVEVAGLPIADLAPGTRLRVGSAVVALQSVTATATAGLCEASGGGVSPALVLASGTLRIGDAVTIDAVPVGEGDVLDLHTFAPADVPAALAASLEQARAAGRTEVRVIHGRGRGVQRARVRALLARSPLVAAVVDADPERGGWGAAIVRLRGA